MPSLLRALSRAFYEWRDGPADYESLHRANMDGSFTPIGYRQMAMHAYGGNVWVYACIHEIAEDLASVTWQALSRNTREPVPDSHPAARFLRIPSRDSDWSEWVEEFVIYLLLKGAVHSEIVASGPNMTGNELLALDLLVPAGLQERPVGPSALYAPFQYQDPDTMASRTIPVERIHRWRYPSPLRRLSEQSPLRPAMETVGGDGQARLWTRKYFENSAVPSGGLTIPKDTTLTPESRKSMLAQLRSGFSGFNAFRAILLEGGATWQNFSKNAREMQVGDMRKLNAMEICAAFKMPPWKIGAAEPKYENYRQARLSLWEETLIPLLDRIKRGLDRLGQRYWPDAILGYDLSDTPAMLDSYDARLESAARLLKMGYPLNAVNERLQLGMKAQPWGDTGLLPTTVAPADLIADSTLPNEGEGDGDDDE